MCDTVVVVGDDEVLFAKNSDRDPNEAQLLEWRPARQHDSGARLRCTWVEVEQVQRTHAVLLSRPFWMWGAEMGANEHGVTIGNEAVYTHEPYAHTGLTGMDLLRLALERAASAAEAVQVVIELLERYGQGGGCGHENRSFTYHSSFLIADPGTAFVLETAGQRWAVEQVTSGVRSISNGLTIPGFAERHGKRLRAAVSRCSTRRALTAGIAAGNPAVQGLIAALRSHGSEPWPRYSALTGGMSAPCVHAGGLVKTAQTTASWVAELRGGGCRHWVTATAAPCISLFKPVRVEEPLDLGPAPADRFDGRTLWWRHEWLHRTVMRDPAAARFLTERDEVERRWLARPPAPVDAFSEADELLAHWSLGVAPGRDLRPLWARRYWQVRDRRAKLPAMAPDGPYDIRRTP